MGDDLIANDDFNKVLVVARMHDQTIPPDIDGTVDLDQEPEAGKVAFVGDWIQRVKTLRAVTAGLKVAGYSIDEILGLVVVILQLIDQLGPQVEEIIKKIKEMFKK